MGSSVKPFVWAEAYESGRFKADDTMLDAPVTYKIGGGRKWSPHNYGDKYYGEVRLDVALWKSLNSVAIKLLKEVDIDKVLEMLSVASGVPVERLPPAFLDLKTRLAGEVLQKFVNYGLKVALVGDISAAVARSEALRDFVRESNRGRSVWFVEDLAALEAKLGARDLASELQATVTQLRFRVAHLEADVRHLEAENLELLRRSGAASAPKMDLGTWRLLLQVAHPDKPPPERQEAATRATQWLTGNKPASAT